MGAVAVIGWRNGTRARDRVGEEVGILVGQLLIVGAVHDHGAPHRVVILEPCPGPFVRVGKGAAAREGELAVPLVGHGRAATANDLAPDEQLLQLLVYWQVYLVKSKLMLMELP